MSGLTKRVMVVHDNQGKAIAVMPVEERIDPSGMRMGFKPVPKQGQHVTEIELDKEQEQYRLEELLECEVMLTGQKPTLRRKIRA